jgi:hypothetical protein
MPGPQTLALSLRDQCSRKLAEKLSLIIDGSVSILILNLHLLSTSMAKTEAPIFVAGDMPFRRLGPSGLRVPVLSLGGCKPSFANAG